MLHWIFKGFHELTPSELYLTMQLRQEVFVLEQKCLYLDADGKDLLSHHLMGFQDKTLVAYSRLVSPGISYLEPSIGRVITARGYRHNGYGKELMRKSIEGIEKLYGKTPIRIGAQVYLMKFYETFGFKQDGIPYLEDGIDHVKMLRLL